MMKTTCPKCGYRHEVNAGALLGSMTSEAKARASRENAKLGGWPKGRPRNNPNPKPRKRK